jgi:Family of unknown function (DUF5681)
MKFLPGQSGNPAGRPLGSLNKKTLALEAAYEAKAEEAVNDIVERAKGGDPAAMRLFMERAVPAGRHRRFSFALPRIQTPEDAEAAIDVVMDGLAEGVLSLPEVAELLRVVERLLQMAESIREMKRVRDFIARRPEAEAHQPDEPKESISVEDAVEVQAALRSLYSSVNTAFAEPGEPPARAPAEATGDGNGSAPVGTQRAAPEPVAA